MNIDILRARKRLITHADCADGVASARLICEVIPDLEVVWCHYNSKQHRELEPGPADIFCDFTPHLSRAGMFVQAGAVVLDHHKGAQELVEQFGERGIFADEDREPGVSGAVLAYRHVWEPLAVLTQRYVKDPLENVEGAAGHRQRVATERFARLIGIRDTWQTGSPFWDDAQAASAFLLMHDQFCSFRRPGAPRLSDSDIEFGRMLVNQRLAKARERVAEAMYVGTAMGVFAVINDNTHVSEAAEALREDNEHGAVALASFGYATDANRDIFVKWSLRSVAPGFDVKVIAQANGGGGHTRAAGFTMRGAAVKRCPPLQALAAAVLATEAAS